MKKTRYFVILLAVLLCLSGCYPLRPMYEQEDADQITQKGTELMQGWLNKNMPGAELRECTADRLMWRGDGNEYLTGYAYGSIEDKDKVTDFAIDTETGDVYFKMDQDTQRALDRAMAAYLYECMGIVQEYDDDGFSCSIMAPSYDQEHFDSFNYGLPAGVKDLDEFVRNPDSRPPIHISKARISIPDDTDISIYDLEAFEKLSEQCGSMIDGLTMANNTQTVTYGSGNAGFYEYGVLLKGNGYALWGAVHVREEKRDSSTNRIILSDQTFTPELDLEFEETEKGFRFSFPNEYWGHGFRFYAKENSELILHNYICYYDGNYVSTISWKEQSQGFYVMVSENQMIMDFYLDGRNLDGRLERAE